MELTLQEIMSISGHPGLFKFVSRGRMGAIVESLTDGKRMTLSVNARASSLSDIAIYTDEGEMPLGDVLKMIREKEQGKAAIDPKGASSNDLKSYFGEILPTYDRQMVYDSHIRKVLAWYNQLQSKDMLAVLDAQHEQPAEGDKADE